MDARLEIAEHVRSTGGAEGAVLLDLRSGKYFALNAVGSLLWEAVAAGASRDETVQRLAERFPEVSAERLERDAGALLGQLEARGLLRPRTGAARDGGASPPAKSAAHASPPRARDGGTVPPAAPQAGASRSAPSPLRSTSITERAPALWTLAAFFGLLLSDAALHLLGFSRFHALVRRCPTRSSPRAGPARARRIVAGVDRASAFYWKRAWCLQRSALTVVLLRLAGLPARLVIAVQRVPFGAHAWAEIDGRVVNDLPAVRRDYEVLETC